MRCRALFKNSTEEDANYNIVFFNSKGTKLPDGFKVKFAINKSNSKTEDEWIIELPCASDTETFEDYSFTFTFTGEGKDSNINLTVSYASNEENSEENLTLSFYCYNSYSSDVLLYNTSISAANLAEEAISLDLEYKDYCMSIPYIEHDKDETKQKDYNYASKQEGVAYSLIQRLSVIKTELWWAINYGLPLLEKIRNKLVFDSVIVNIIYSHPDITNIENISSKVLNNHIYFFEATMSTIYGENITISNTIGS